MKKNAAIIILASFLICLCTSCATTNKSSKKTDEPVIENVNVRGIWTDLTSDDEEFIKAIAGNNKFEEI